MYCNQCGAANADQAQFCMKCGTAILHVNASKPLNPILKFTIIAIPIMVILIIIGLFVASTYFFAVTVPQMEKSADKLGREANSDIVAMAKSDMRSMATAIEAYNIDCSEYPVSRVPLGEALPPMLIGYSRGKAHSLTSPIGYLVSFPTDPFRPDLIIPIPYWRAGKGEAAGWVLFCAGPDQDYDLDWMAYAHDSETNLPTAESMNAMVNGIYDPTNGIGGNGDIVRFKQ